MKIAYASRNWVRSSNSAFFASARPAGAPPSPLRRFPQPRLGVPGLFFFFPPAFLFSSSRTGAPVPTGATDGSKIHRNPARVRLPAVILNFGQSDAKSCATPFRKADFPAQVQIPPSLSYSVCSQYVAKKVAVLWHLCPDFCPENENAPGPPPKPSTPSIDQGAMLRAAVTRHLGAF